MQIIEIVPWLAGLVFREDRFQCRSQEIEYFTGATQAQDGDEWISFTCSSLFEDGFE